MLQNYVGYVSFSLFMEPLWRFLRAVQGSGSRGCGHLTAGAVSSSQSAFALVLVNTFFCQRSVVPKLVTANCIG